LIDDVGIFVARHRREVFVATMLFLIGCAVALFGIQRFRLAETELSRLQSELAAMQQRARILREADSILNQISVTAPDLTPEHKAFRQPGLTLVALQEQAIEEQGWHSRGYRLQGKVIHEEVLFDALESWIGLSEFQHQVRGCRIERQDAGLAIDCRLSMLLPTR